MGDGPAGGEARHQVVWEAVDETRMRQMLEHLPAYAVMADRELNYLWVNRLDPTLRPDQVIGHNASEFIAADYLPMVRAKVQEALTTGRPTHYETRGYADGTMESWYTTTVVPLPAEDPARVRVLLLSNDISKRHAAEEGLRDSEQRFRMLTESLPDLVVIVDAQQRCIFLNREPSPEQVAAPVEVLGRTVRELTLDADADIAVERVAHTLRTGEPTEYETLNEQGRTFACRVLRLRSAEQSPEALITATDVTERREAERAQADLQLQLQRAQSLETVGRLAGGIAHDFNNLLLVIQGHLTLVEGAAGAGPEAAEHLGAIGKAAERAAEMTQRLLTIGRREKPKPSAVDLGALARDGMRLLRRVIPEAVELCFDAPVRPAVVFADRGQLDQVVMNLCLNARDATEQVPRAGRISVTVGLEDGGTALLAVSDNGCGMSEATAAQVYEPFFTTKEPGRGTGLGLSVVHSVVAQNGGALSMRTTEGEGTTFEIRFPLHQAKAPVREARELPAVRGDATGTILVAEDEPAVRQIVTHILRSAGYVVLEAADGQEAIEVFDRHADEIDAVLMDAIMPTLGGRDAFERLLERRPGMKALFTSGYSAEALPPSFLEAHALRVLPKPYRPADLLAALEQLLAAE